MSSDQQENIDEGEGDSGSIGNRSSATLSIGGDMFAGILYDQSPRHESKERIEEHEKESASKETEQCFGVDNPETSGNELEKVTIVDPSSENIEVQEEESASKEMQQCLDVFNQLGQVTIDDRTSEKDSGWKETSQRLGVVGPETSRNQEQVTIYDLSSENIEEDSGSKETEKAQEISSDHQENIEEDSGSKETEKAQEMSSDHQENIEEDSGSKGTEPCLGEVTIGNPSSENIEEQEKDSGSKETEQCLGVVGLETSENQAGQITIDVPSSGDSGGNVAKEHMVSYEFLEFPYELLVTATGNFSARISAGYHGSLHRGTLSDISQEVAVKLLNNFVTRFSNDDLAKFAHRIGRASHPNIVKFVGYCNERLERHMLVYEFIPTTLASYLHGTYPPLDWATRMNILHGVAKALDYLHWTATPRVIYGDLESSNILLDGGEAGCFRPKLCGFGLGKFKHNGYCAHSHTRNDEVSTKCDIFCFGLLILELLTGRKVFDRTRGSTRGPCPWLLDWVKIKVLDEPKGIQDPALKGKVDQATFGRAFRFAILCTKKDSNLSDLHLVLSDTMDYLTGQKEVEEYIFAEEEEKKTNKKNKKNKKS